MYVWLKYISVRYLYVEYTLYTGIIWKLDKVFACLNVAFSLENFIKVYRIEIIFTDFCEHVPVNP